MCGKPPEEGKENLVPSEKWQGGTVELPKMAVAWLRRESLKAVIAVKWLHSLLGESPLSPVAYSGTVSQLGASMNLYQCLLTVKGILKSQELKVLKFSSYFYSL